jgi:hypothetical protein
VDDSYVTVPDIGVNATTLRWCQRNNFPTPPEVQARMEDAFPPTGRRGAHRPTFLSVYFGLLARAWRAQGYNGAEIRDGLSAAKAPDDEHHADYPPLTRHQLRSYEKAAKALEVAERDRSRSATVAAKKVVKRLIPATDRANELLEKARQEGRNPRTDPGWLEAEAKALELGVQYRRACANAGGRVRQTLVERNPPEETVRWEQDAPRLVDVRRDEARLLEAERLQRRAAELRGQRKPAAPPVRQDRLGALTPETRKQLRLGF